MSQSAGLLTTGLIVSKPRSARTTTAASTSALTVSAISLEASTTRYQSNRSKQQPTPVLAEVWFFSNNVARMHNAVNARVPFKVYRYQPAAKDECGTPN